MWITLLAMNTATVDSRMGIQSCDRNSIFSPSPDVRPGRAGGEHSRCPCRVNRDGAPAQTARGRTSPARCLIREGRGIRTRAARLQLLAAFLVVFLIWGGTYAAIRIGVMAVPPAMLSGVRFLIAGICMTA